MVELFVELIVKVQSLPIIVAYNDKNRLKGENLMVNRGSEESNQRQWYPQLPEGFENNNQQRHGGPQPGMPGFQPGYGGQQPGMPGFQPGHGGQQPGMPGFPPGHGGQQPGRPGFPPGHGGPQHGGPGFPPGHGGQQPGRPGFPPGHGGPQHGGPGFPPGHGGPPGQHQGNQAPTSAPPNMTPEYPTHQAFAIDPGAIAGCMYRFTYVWLSRRQGFWFYPVFVGRTSIAGYRWNNRRRRWEYTGLDLNNIDKFTCF